MADKKISELNEASSLNNSDVMPVVQSNETKKSTLATLISFLNSKLSFLKRANLIAGDNITLTDSGGDVTISSGGVSDYGGLTNKPQINGVTLTGNKTSANLNLVGTSNIATSITSSSTNDEVAGAKAVYDYAQDDYSTTERVVGTWINGKPLYEKTFFTTAPTTTDGSHTSTNVRYANNVEYAFIVAHWVVDGADQHQPLPYVNNAGNQLKGFITTAANNGHGYYMDSSIAGYNGATIVAIIRYTKTTDTATTTSLNTVSLMNTGSLVGMGDRAELGVIGDSTNATDNINETTNTASDSGDTI